MHLHSYYDFLEQVAPMQLNDLNQIEIQIFFEGIHHLVAGYQNLDAQDGHLMNLNPHMYFSQVKGL